MTRIRTSQQTEGDIYTFVQGIPDTLWSINHKLSKFPSVTVVDSSGRVVYGDIVYIDMNNVTVEFSAAFSGTAYLN